MTKSKDSEVAGGGVKRKLENGLSSSKSPKKIRPDQASKTQLLRMTASKASPSSTVENPLATAQEDVENANNILADTKKFTKMRNETRGLNGDVKDPQEIAEQVNIPSDGAIDKTERRRQRKKEKQARRQSSKPTSKAEAHVTYQNEQKRNKKMRRGAKAETESQPMDIDSSTESSQWRLNPAKGGRLLDQDPIFANDNKGRETLIAATDHEVQVLSLRTSLIEATHPAPDGLRISYVSKSENGDGVVYIVYSDGTMARWDPHTRANIGLRVPLNRHRPYALAAAPKTDSADDLFTLIEREGSSCIQLNGKDAFVSTQQLFDIQIVGESEYVVALGRMAVIIGRKTKPEDKAFVWIEMPVSRSLICGHVKPVTWESAKKRPGLSIALGNIDGEIHLYDDVSALFHPSKPKVQPAQKLHWHREAVCSLKFSSDGNYLISGGRETVLVLWQLSTSKKQFLPHLTSTIERIVINAAGNKYALQMGDNSVMVLSTSELKPIANFAGLQIADGHAREGSIAQRQQAAIIWPGKSTQLLLAVPPTRPRHLEDAVARSFLQTFDLRDSRHIARQALTRNNVTDFRLGPGNVPIVTPDITHMAIDTSGKWLATVDEWVPPVSDFTDLVPDNVNMMEEERLKRREVYLKFWKWDEVDSIWMLVTRVDAPHSQRSKGASGAGRVFALAADPSGAGFATLGEDGIVRTWRHKTRMRSGVVMKVGDDTELITWVSSRVVALPQDIERADSPLEEDEAPVDTTTHACLAFAEDGSMLAAAQTYEDSTIAPLVHFIRVGNGEFITKHTVAPPDLVSMVFIDRYLVSVAHKRVHVWDYVENRLNGRFQFYSEKTEPPLLAANPATGTFAVATPHQINLYEVGQAQALPLQTVLSNEKIAALLSNGRGYTLVFDNATIRQILPPAQPGLRSRSPEIADESLPTDDPEEEAASIDLVNQLINTTLTTKRSMVQDSVDDRPVVQPEQLALALETAPSVDDMFQAVMGLYSRKPHVRPA